MSMLNTICPHCGHDALPSEVGKAAVTGAGAVALGKYTRTWVGLVFAAGMLVKKAIELGDQVKCSKCGEFYEAFEYEG